MALRNKIILVLCAVILTIASFIFLNRFYKKSAINITPGVYSGTVNLSTGKDNSAVKVNLPSVVSGSTVDSNNDGITDAEAVKQKLDPYKTDTDGDGMPDIDEIKITKTDPLKADTDGDGINDLDEINKYNTDPLKADKKK